MSDLFQRLNGPRKVKPRTNDGFVDSTKEIAENITKTESIDTEDKSQSKLIVETSKPKLLTLEVSVRQEVDRILYENPDLSWDTLIESALITCFNNQNIEKRILKLAKERLAARKESSVYKRSVTMAKKYT